MEITNSTAAYKKDDLIMGYLYCPFGKPDGYHQTCLKEGCAFYIVSSDICSIPKIAVSLQDIYEELHEIRTRIQI